MDGLALASSVWTENVFGRLTKNRQNEEDREAVTQQCELNTTESRVQLISVEREWILWVLQEEKERRAYTYRYLASIEIWEISAECLSPHSMLR